MNKHSPLTALERALAEALKWRIRYDDVNPNVGMGPTHESLLIRVLADAKIPKTGLNLEGILYKVASE